MLKNTIKVGSIITAFAIMQFAFSLPTPALAAQGCPLNTFYGTVTVDGVATDNVTVTLTDVTNGSPALSVITSLGGFYQIDTSNLNICAVAGDQIQLNATFNAFSANATSSFVVEPLTNVNLAISSTATTYNIVSVASTAGGTISPAGTTIVNSGASQSYTITPNAGYHIANVLVDGSSVGIPSSYTFNNVTAAHTINASFAIDTYSIVSSAGINGSIAPLGTTTINYGGNQSYTITPNTNYAVADVLVDQVSVGAVTAYTFTNVTATHSIDVSFIAVPIIAPIPQQNGIVGQAVTFNVVATNPNQGMLMYSLDANAPIGAGIDMNGVFTWTPSIAGTYNFNVIVDDMIAAPVSSPVTIIVTITPPVDIIAPVITLLGANPMDVVQGNVFTDPGATATDDVDGNITASIAVTGIVDTNTLGAYTLTYNVSDAVGNPATAVTRTVNVVATPPADTTAPVITLFGLNPMEVVLNGTFTDPGATSTDNVDENVAVNATGTVNTAIAGSYYVIYTAIDSSGNTASSTRRVDVLPAIIVSGGGGGGFSFGTPASQSQSASLESETEIETAPVITLLGANPIDAIQGNVFADPGATATDDVDGNITASIAVTGIVDINTLGAYTLTYNVSDAVGNPATAVTRTVNVIAAPLADTPPVDTMVQEQSHVLGASVFFFDDDLKFGEKNNDVLELQNRLTNEGYYNGPITGYFGNMTLAAIQRYQNNHGLPLTGFFGSLTRRLMNQTASVISENASLNTQLKQQILELQKQVIKLIIRLQQMKAQTSTS